MTTQPERPAITPDLGVAALLTAYPELEPVLIDRAPVFQKLRNPALRRTVARLTTLRQAARTAEITVGELITDLRVAAGLEEPWEEGAPGPDGATQGAGARPDWLAACASVETYDAREQIEGGGHPLPTVMEAVARLAPGQAYALVTPFRPAPLIEKVEQRGLRSWTEQRGPAHFVTYFARA